MYLHPYKKGKKIKLTSNKIFIIPQTSTFHHVANKNLTYVITFVKKQMINI